MLSLASRLESYATQYESVMGELRAPENLKLEDRETSVELAREILERLRNMKLAPADRDQRSMFSGDKDEENKQILELATLYKLELAKIADAENDSEGKPSNEKSQLKNNQILNAAALALEKLSFRMKLDAYNALVQEQGPEAARGMKRDLDKTPETYKTSESTETLLGHVDRGLQEAASIQRQARIAQKMAQREQQRQALREAKRAQRASNTAQVTKMVAKASRASKPSAAMAAALSNFKGQQPAASEESWAGARVNSASGNAFEQVQTTQRQIDEEEQRRRSAPPPVNDPNSNRGR